MNINMESVMSIVLHVPEYLQYTRKQEHGQVNIMNKHEQNAKKLCNVTSSNFIVFHFLILFKVRNLRHNFIVLHMTT